ncbi:MAG: DNA internalization-related competence protein ComEC/Rec2 [Gammaproteobacteria bacterium]|jgi:competence protein ComEC
MQLASLGFLAGVLISQTLAVLPPKNWSLLIVILVPLVFRFPAFRVVLCLALGFLYSVFIAHDKLEGQISPALEGHDLVLTGTIASIPDLTHRRSRFLVDVTDLNELPADNRTPTKATSNGQLPQRVRLTWYRAAPTLHVGQQWQWIVRLKAPRGFANPGGFDYEGWLFRNNIQATGYIRDTRTTHSQIRLLGENNQWAFRLNRFRESLVDQLDRALPDNRFSGLVTALLVGHRQGITTDQWSVLTATGTNHLMAISGLHIGLVAGMVYWLIVRLWRRLPGLALYLAAPRAAALSALLAALVYAALAGFTLPTQRAVIMVGIVMLAVWRQRPVNPGQILAIALFAVLLYDPVSVISGSFWLSFGAVAIILYTMAGRLPVKTWWWKWGRVQWVIAVGLFPLLLFWFQQVPLLSPLANFVAVPWVSFVTVPLTLIGGGTLALWPALAHGLIVLAAGSLAALWPLLKTLAGLNDALWFSSQPPLWTFLPALLGILWLLAPRGVPARWLGAVWLLPLAFFPRQHVPDGAVRLTVLDVGQGLATVIRTAKHVAVYDAGPRYSAQFNAGDAVVVPFLRARGIETIDRLILSHDDRDHTGGYDAIVRQMPVTQVMATANVQWLWPGQAPSGVGLESCVAGEHWSWDGVGFRVLHPGVNFQDARDNNWSCVIQITTQTDKILLTGDIEQPVEAELVKYFDSDDDNLRADVLVVPHHGSRSSSSDAFVRAVDPEYALISAGYKNRYGLPKADILQRYRDTGAHILQTDSSGAISLLLGTGKDVNPVLYRRQSRRYWSNGSH